MKLFCQYFFCLLLLFSCNTANKNPVSTSNDTDHAVDGNAIKKALDDAYRVIGFKKGQLVNFKDIKKCFIPQAQLINFRNDSMEILSIDQFVEVYKTFLSTNAVTAFYEEEIKGSTDQFGRIAQRISTYKTYINHMDSAAERGVNSFQLIKTEQGWKVSSIIWDIESAKLKIPGYYLKNGITP